MRTIAVHIRASLVSGKYTQALLIQQTPSPTTDAKIGKVFHGDEA